jgi:hypothetical protein
MTGARLTARAFVAALLTLAASACMSFSDPMHHEDNFRDHMRTFTQYVRWGNFSGAAGYLVEDQKDAFLDLAQQLSDVRFTEYEILRQDLNESRTAATVEITLTGYRLSSPISRTVRLRQDWKRIEGSSRWEVRIELENMRAALGLAAK